MLTEMAIFGRQRARTCANVRLGNEGICEVTPESLLTIPSPLAQIFLHGSGRRFQLK